MQASSGSATKRTSAGCSTICLAKQKRQLQLILIYMHRQPSISAALLRIRCAASQSGSGRSVIAVLAYVPDNHFGESHVVASVFIP
jgi:hypothetical protein